MRIIIAFLFFIAANFISYGQCSSVSISVSSSDTTYIQLYHAGFFNIPSGFANVCEWEVTSFSGDIIFQETTSGDAFEQGLVLFDHSIPITDSMKATLVITNDSIGITCTIKDTLYWQEIEVLPGSFIGNWAVLSNNVGMEEEINTSTKRNLNIPSIELFPSLVYDHFNIKSDLEIYSFAILDLNGQVVIRHTDVGQQERVDVSRYPAGMYFIQFWDKNNGHVGTKKIVKM